MGVILELPLALLEQVGEMGRVHSWAQWLAHCQDLLHVTAPGEAPPRAGSALIQEGLPGPEPPCTESCFALVISHSFAELPLSARLCAWSSGCAAVSKTLRILGLWPDALWLLGGSP